MRSGGDVVSAEIRAKHCSPLACDVIDLNTGEHRVSYTANVGGIHELHVFVRQEPVRGSPFMLSVHAAATAAACCELDTSQLLGVQVGQPSPFMITALTAIVTARSAVVMPSKPISARQTAHESIF